MSAELNKSHTAYIALGSNLGERQLQLYQALEALAKVDGVAVSRVSSFYETNPVGGPVNQPRFINAAAKLETTLTAHELLRAMLQIELQLGRDRSNPARNQPRTLDLDLLLFDDALIDDAELCVPHPRMHERGFVLQPLNEIAPDVFHPLLKLKVSALLAALHAV